MKKTSKKVKKELKEKEKKIKNMMSDFKEFASKGNILDMAIGLTMGTAFTKIVNSLVTEIISPILGYITKGIDFNTLFIALSKEHFNTIEEAKANGVITINYGVCITAIIDFLVIAFAIFIVIRIKDRARNKILKKEVVEKVNETKECPYCLSSINIKATRCPYCTNILEGYKEKVESIKNNNEEEKIEK